LKNKPSKKPTRIRQYAERSLLRARFLFGLLSNLKVETKYFSERQLTFNGAISQKTELYILLGSVVFNCRMNAYEAVGGMRTEMAITYFKLLFKHFA
jgi:hypothetical protein